MLTGTLGDPPPGRGPNETETHSCRTFTQKWVAVETAHPIKLHNPSLTLAAEAMGLWTAGSRCSCCLSCFSHLILDLSVNQLFPLAQLLGVRLSFSTSCRRFCQPRDRLLETSAREVFGA